MTEFREEFVYEVAPEIGPLLDQHYEELTLNKDRIKLAPMWDEYQALEVMGRFKIFTARDGDRLLGYSAYFLNSHMHYRELVVAQNDVFYLSEECRKGSTPLRFLRHCEATLRAMGAQKVVYHCKPQNNFAPILHRMGYADEEVMCGKLL